MRTDLQLRDAILAQRVTVSPNIETIFNTLIQNQGKYNERAIIEQNLSDDKYYGFADGSRNI